MTRVNPEAARSQSVELVVAVAKRWQFAVNSF